MADKKTALLGWHLFLNAKAKQSRFFAVIYQRFWPSCLFQLWLGLVF